jgi:tetratricopeptide (TPR) repeat protein
MQMTQGTLGTALEHHRNGRLAEASSIYRQILAANPLDADCLHLLGMVAHQIGRHDDAVELIGKAIAIDRRSASYHSNLGTVLQAQGKLKEAAGSYRRALALRPDMAEGHMNLGVVLQRQGRLAEGEAEFRSALALRPEMAEIHVNLGNVLQAQGKHDEAIISHERALALKPEFAEACFSLGNDLQAMGKLDEAVANYQRALAHRPDMAEIHGNLGNALLAQNKLGEAVAEYERALALKPNYAEAFYNLGNAHNAQSKLAEAVSCYQRAVALRPELPEAHYNLGNTLQALDDLEGAAACFERTVALRPTYAQAHYNLACVLQSLGRLEEAFAPYARAVQLEPDFSQARFGQALAQLLNGEFDPGWRNYESRWQSLDHQTAMRPYRQPVWKGETLSSGRVLLWGEQGVGDEVLFAGLIPDALRTGNQILLDCDPRLKPLLARSFPGIQVFSGLDAHAGSAELEFAAHLPTGSLPGLFRPTEQSFAATASPYLKANPDERERLRARYGDGRRLIGLAWHTVNQKTGPKRSIRLGQLAPLLAAEGVRWVSLQYGKTDRLEAEVAAASAPVVIDRAVDQLLDLDLFAAQIAAMDLVITIDNSTAHLASALGIPTWLLLPFAPDWRWLTARETSPWYPTLRIFRQPRIGDWPSVIERVRSALDGAFRKA